MIKKSEKEGIALAQIFPYTDVEREGEVEQKIRNELKSHRGMHQLLKDKKDLLNRAVIELDKNIELN